MDGKAGFSHFEAKNLITTALPNQVTRPQGIGKGLVDSPVASVSSWNLMEAVDVWFRRDFEYDIPWYNS